MSPGPAEAASGETGYERGIGYAGFVDESTLYTSGDGGVRRWDVETGAHELIMPAEPRHVVNMAMSPVALKALVASRPLDDVSRACRAANLLDLATGALQPLPAFGECLGIGAMALDISGTVAVTGDRDGIVRVGRLSAAEPHLLFGHQGPVEKVAVSPDLRWVASSGEDDTLRLWPMPDLDRPPLHTLPREELLAKLKSLTNVRAVRDPKAPDGWRIELAPFPGWQEVPTW